MAFPLFNFSTRPSLDTHRERAAIFGVNMRRIILALILCLIPSLALGAMTCVDNDGSNLHKAQGDVYRIYITCTFDTTPGTAVANMPAVAQSIIDQGRYVYRFSIIPGTTGPTDNSDLQILDGNDLTIVSASGNGANVIDNATSTSWIYGDGPTAGSTNAYPLGDGSPWEITVSNNAVNNSSFKMIMQAVK